MKQTLGTLVCVIFLGALSLPAQSVASSAKKGFVPFFGNSLSPISGKPVNMKFYAEKDGQRIYTSTRQERGIVRKAFQKFQKKAYPKLKDLKNAKCAIKTSHKAKQDVTLDFQGYRVHFCCKMCKKAFLAEPRKHLALLTHPGVKDAKNKMCPVSGDEKVEADSFFIYRGHLIGTCCDDCLGDFNKDPARYLKVLGLKGN